MLNKINKIAVIGSGAMGSQIAMVSALAGYEVILHDIREESLVTALDSLHGHMNRRIKKGKLTEKQVEDAFNRITSSTSLESTSGVDFVIEAIVEKLEVKREVFAQLDQIVPQHAILATNSSTIVSSKIANATQRPEKVCNVHFFNPVLVMELVEVMVGPHTSDETALTSFDFIKSINKIPILLKKEISGFIANRLLGRLTDEAIYLLENGYATHEEIDLVCTKALNHPMGPFQLMDFSGVDVHYYVRSQRYKETGDERDRPSKIVEEMVKRGELGRKSGKGFYTYDLE